MSDSTQGGRNGGNDAEQAAELEGKVHVATPTDSSLEESVKRLRSLEAASGSGKGDLAELMVANWRVWVGAAGAVLVCVWLFNAYSTSRVDRINELSSKYDGIARSYEAYVKAQSDVEELKATSPLPAEKQETLTKKLEELGKQKRSLEELIQSVGRAKDESFYGRVALMYGTLVQSMNGDMNSDMRTGDSSGGESGAQGIKLAEIENALSYLNIKQFESNQAPRSGKEASAVRFEDEVGALLVGRIGLRSSEPAERERGAQILKGLSLGGRFLNVEALNARYAVAASEVEREQVRADSRALVLSRPELSELLQGELGLEAGSGDA